MKFITANRQKSVLLRKIDFSSDLLKSLDFDYHEFKNPFQFPFEVRISNITLKQKKKKKKKERETINHVRLICCLVIAAKNPSNMHSK